MHCGAYVDSGHADSGFDSGSDSGSDSGIDPNSVQIRESVYMQCKLRNLENSHRDCCMWMTGIGSGVESGHGARALCWER